MADIDEWQTEMQLKPMRVGGFQLFTSGLNDEERKITGVDQISSVAEAVSLSMEEQKSEEVAVIPEGPYLVPFMELPSQAQRKEEFR